MRCVFLPRAPWFRAGVRSALMCVCMRRGEPCFAWAGSACMQRWQLYLGFSSSASVQRKFRCKRGAVRGEMLWAGAARCYRGTRLAVRAFQPAFFRFFTEVCWRVLGIGGVSGEKVKDIPQNTMFRGISLSVEVNALRTSVKNAHIFILRRPKGGVSEGEAFELLAESFAPVCYPPAGGVA